MSSIAPSAGAGDYRMGLRLALLSLAIAMAAINTGNNLLYLMLSLVLALAVVSLAASSRAIRSLRVALLLPEEAACGEPFLVGAEVTGRFPLLPQTWVRVRIEGLPEPVELTVAVPAASGRGVASGHAVVHQRGEFDGLQVSALTGYPLDLTLRQARHGWCASLVVLPRFARISRLRVAPARGGSQRGGASAPSRRPGGAGGDLHNLREYTTSDDARHIDWRASARARQLMLREFEREEDRRLDLVLDVAAADPVAFEAAVERCAAILDFARRERLDARLLVAGAAPLAGREAMRRLAAVTPVPDADGSLDAALAFARRDAEIVVVSADPGRSTPIEIS